MFSSLVIVPTRNVVAFFNKKTQEHLWKSATSVSTVGRKRGRAKGRKQIKDLNRGQRIGVGVANTQYPGLNTPLFSTNRIDMIRRPDAGPLPHMLPTRLMPKDEEGIERRAEIRDEARKRTKLKLNPLERGWSGIKMHGRRLGAPHVNDVHGNPTPLEGFESMCLQLKRVSHMTGNFGRVDSMSAFVVVGNGRGVAGWSCVKKPDPRSALVAAIDYAGRRLTTIELFEKRTIYQDFYAEAGRTRLFARRVPAGNGLVCHRALIGVCQMFGIKDIYIKVEGGDSNVQAMTKAFFTGLVNQESFQQLAERKRLHVVAFDSADNYYPKVVASPKSADLRTEDQLDDDEVLDINDMYGEGRTPLFFETPPPFWTNLDDYKVRQFHAHPWRNQQKVMWQLMADDVLDRWTREKRMNVGKRMHEIALANDCVPRGLGLSDVYREGREEEGEEELD